jgi:hypothetical protein
MSDVVELRKKVKELRAKQVPITKATLEDLQREVKADADLKKLEEKRAKMAAIREAKVKEKEKKCEGPVSPAPPKRQAKAAKAKVESSMPLASMPAGGSDADEAPVHTNVNIDKKKKKVVE